MEPQVPVCYRHPSVPTRISCQRCERPICPDCMVEGTVGFQCPDCVATGRKETRQRQLPHGGKPSANPQATSIVLVVINLVVFAAVWATGRSFGRVFNWFALSPQGHCPYSDTEILLAPKAECLALGHTWVDGVATGAWWQVLTSAFTHSAPVHLAFNMLAVWVLGPQVERILGRARYLGLYLTSAVVGSAFVMWFSEPHSATVGASGALFGLMAAILLLSWRHGGNWQQIMMWIGLNVLITIWGSNFISWQGHLGGFIGGLVVCAALIFLPRQQRGWQWPLIVVINAAAIAAIVGRALMLA